MTIRRIKAIVFSFCLLNAFCVFAQTETIQFLKTQDWGSGYNGKINVTPNYAINTPWTFKFTIPTGSNVSAVWVTGAATSFSVATNVVTVLSSGTVNIAANSTIAVEFTLNNGSASVTNFIFTNGNKTSGGGGGTTASVSCNTAYPWNTGWVYDSGDEAVVNNVKYRANWYSLGQNPSTNSGVSQVWTVVGNCQTPITYTKVSCDNVYDWKATTLYSQNDKAVLNGYLYQAKWTHSNNNPEATSGANKTWTRVGLCDQPINYTTVNCIGKPDWNITQNYSINDQVFYNGKLYKANYNNNYQNPESTQAWTLVSSCTGGSNQAWVLNSSSDLWNNNLRSVLIGASTKISPSYLNIAKLEVKGDVYASGRMKAIGIDVYVNPDPTATDPSTMGGAVYLAPDGVAGITFKPKAGGGSMYHIQATNDNKLHYSMGEFGSKMDYQVVDGTGNVGIGVGTPLAKLHVGGDVQVDGNLIIKPGSGKGIVFEDGTKVISLTDITNTLAQDVWVKKDNNAYIAHTGKVLIGDAITRSFPQDFSLAVNGKVLATEVLVRKYTNWTNLPDYVFEKNYVLMPLGELEHYVEKNKHLPEVPSAKEMAKNGIELADMNVTLLKKVEELTLYVIEQNKKLEKQGKELEDLKNKIK